MLEQKEQRSCFFLLNVVNLVQAPSSMQMREGMLVFLFSSPCSSVIKDFLRVIHDRYFLLRSSSDSGKSKLFFIVFFIIFLNRERSICVFVVRNFFVWNSRGYHSILLRNIYHNFVMKVLINGRGSCTYVPLFTFDILFAMANGNSKILKEQIVYRGSSKRRSYLLSNVSYSKELRDDGIESVL